MEGIASSFHYLDIPTLIPKWWSICGHWLSHIYARIKHTHIAIINISNVDGLNVRCLVLILWQFYSRFVSSVPVTWWPMQKRTTILQSDKIDNGSRTFMIYDLCRFVPTIFLVFAYNFFAIKYLFYDNVIVLLFHRSIAACVALITHLVDFCQWNIQMTVCASVFFFFWYNVQP